MSLQFESQPSRAQAAEHQVILPDAPAAYLATWPIEELLQAWHARQLPGVDSAHAGTFLCNHIFFHALHDAASAPRQMPCAFMHLPRLPTQIPLLPRSEHSHHHALPLNVLVDCVQVAIDQIMAPSIR